MWTEEPTAKESTDTVSYVKVELYSTHAMHRLRIHMWNRHVQSQGIVSTKFKVVVGGMGMTQDDVVGEHTGLSLVPVMSSFSQVGVSLHYLYFFFPPRGNTSKKKWCFA